MANCAFCSVEITFFNKPVFKSGFKGGEAICLRCFKKLNNANPNIAFHLSKHTLAEAQLALNKQSEKTANKLKNNADINDNAINITILEYKRTCVECGKVWHVLDSREKKLEKDIKTNNCNKATASCGMCSGSYDALGASAQTMRNDQALSEEIGRLKQCPNCNSGNYNQESIVYDKK